MRIYRPFHMCLNQNNTTKEVRFASFFLAEKQAGICPTKGLAERMQESIPPQQRKAAVGRLCALRALIIVYDLLSVASHFLIQNF